MTTTNDTLFQEILPEAVAEEELLHRARRKLSYHLLGSKNKLPVGEDEEYDDPLFQHLTTKSAVFVAKDQVEAAKELKVQLLRDLGASGGDVTTSTFLCFLERLAYLYDPVTFDARQRPKNRKLTTKKTPELEGMWITLSRPNFGGCQGLNDNGEYMYDLGRMSFGMLQPANLMCSIQGTFNPVRLVPSNERKAALKDIPSSLNYLSENNEIPLRTYNVVTAFTIEPYKSNFGEHSPNRRVQQPIQGLMTTKGYAVPDPENPSTLAVHFVSGAIEVDDLKDIEGWKAIFTKREQTTKTTTQLKSPKATKPTRRPFRFGWRLRNQHKRQNDEEQTEHTIDLEEDGKMSYRLNRDSHETPYLDILYFDETLRISRSNSGLVYVMVRVPNFEYDVKVLNVRPDGTYT